VTQLEIRRDTALEAMKVGKEIGAITILNPAPAQEKVASTIKSPTEEDKKVDDIDFYRNVDILVPNETELRTLLSDGRDGSAIVDVIGNDQDDEVEMAKRLLQLGVRKAVVVTLGSRGAMVVSRTRVANNKDGDEEDFVVKRIQADPNLPWQSEPVVDTVGAGDCFCGSFAAYLSTGLELTDAATRACAVASMSVRKMGAQSSYPCREDLPNSLRVDRTDDDTDYSENCSGHSSKIGKQVTFVTGNKKKVEEIERLIVTSIPTAKGGRDIMGLPFRVTNRKIDLPELQGDPIDIAIEKCKLAAIEVNGPVFSEDTCLCFNALNGMPGPYIKWFLDKCGHGGLNRMLDGFDDKTAYAQTIIAFTTGPDQKVHTFDGRTRGKIVKARGPLNFGWDPIFEPDSDDGGCGKTYAEMEKEEKNLISQRSRSFAKFLPFLIENMRDA